MPTKGYPEIQENVGVNLQENGNQGEGLKICKEDISKAIGPNEQLYENTINDLIKKLKNNPNESIEITPEYLKIIVENAPENKDKNILHSDYVAKLYSYRGLRFQFYEIEETGDFELIVVDGKEKRYKGKTKKHAAAMYFQEKGDYVFESARSVLSYLNNYLEKNGFKPNYRLCKIGTKYVVECRVYNRYIGATRDSIYEAICEVLQNLKHEVDDYERTKKIVNSTQK